MAWPLVGLRDRLRHHAVIRGLASRSLLAADRLSRGGPASGTRIHRLCAAARLAPDGKLLSAVEARIAERMRAIDPVQVARELPAALRGRHIAKAAILKARVGPRERGVVIVSFEHQWARLLDGCDLRAFARDYTLVVSPTWSPPHGLVTYLFPAVYPDRIFTLISNDADVAHLARISPKYVVVPLLASNWVNPALFRPRPFGERDIDILMVANFATYKRHHALFRALRRLPPRLKVVLIGQANGARTASVLLDEAGAYGVAGRFELRENLPDEAVCEAFSRAKVSLILSRREGSCVAVVESLFADTPVGLYEDAHVGSRRYVNPATGRLLAHRDLAGQIEGFLAEAPRFRARDWALGEGIDCHGSTSKLNEALRREALSEGQEWTQDIAVHHWRPDPRLLEAEDSRRLRSAYDDVRQRFGLEIG